MVINETLARGLKDRFFEDFQRDVTASRNELSKVRVGFQKKNRWIKAARTDLGRMHRFSLGSYEGGSTNKPYFVVNLLEALEDRPYNAWNEKCLCSVQILLAFDPRQFRWFPGLFNIGEHAIARLYLRSPVDEDQHGSLLPYSIIKQLRHVPFWTTFWVWTHSLLKSRGMEIRDVVSPIVPAPNGLFLSEFSKDRLPIEIRTFIGDLQMSDERRFIRDLMISISEPLLQSPMSASPAIEGCDVDSSGGILTAIVCKQLSPQIEMLAKFLFHEPNDKPDVKRVFGQQMQQLGNEADGCWQAFHNLPLKEFLTAINQMLRKQ